MTWGEIRLLLQQTAGPGVSLDRIDEAMNARYELILATMNWQGLEVSANLPTKAAYSTGTIALTQGSNVVVGSGTVWTMAMNGLVLVNYGGCSNASYVVTITSPTTLVLDRPFEDVSNTAAGYALVQQIYQLPDNCRRLRIIQNPVTGQELGEITEDGFAQYVGFSASCWGEADYFAPKPNGVDAQTGATVKQILLFPTPMCGRAYPITYEISANEFTGLNTGDSPLEFVSANAILAGARATLMMEKQSAIAAVYEVLYDRHMMAMINVENGQRGPERMRMANRFTQYRRCRPYR